MTSGAPRRVVLYDAYPHAYGGAQRTDHLIAAALPERGWAPTVVVPAPGPFPERLVADGIAVEIVPAPPSLQRYGHTTTGTAKARALLALPGYWRRLGRALRSLQPDVVHVIDHRGLLLAGVPARRAGARLVWQIHAVDSTRWINRLGGRVAHRVLLPTTAVLSALPGLERGGDVRAAGTVVAASVPRRPVSAPLASSPILVTVARLHPEKGLDVLVDALAVVRASVPGTTLRIVGPTDGASAALAEELRGQAVRLGISDAVELCGALDAPHEIVSTARVYVQPSRAEVIPLAVLEAMAQRVPVIATDVGAVGTIVEDDVTGLLVPPEQPDALAAAIVRMLQDDALAERLRHAGGDLVAGGRFEPEALVDAVVAAYEDRPDG